MGKSVLNFWRVGGISFGIALLFCGCASEKRMVLPVDARFANLYYAGYVNESNITLLEHWPADSVKNHILLSTFEAISRSLEAELKKYAQAGRYHYIDRKDLAMVEVRLHFLPCELKDNALILPVEVRVTDVRKQQTLKRAFVGYGRVPEPRKTAPKAEKDYFHFYGVLLQEAGRSFPDWQIAQLFYPHEENSY